MLIFNQPKTQCWFTDPWPRIARAKCHIPIWISGVSDDNLLAELRGRRHSFVLNHKFFLCVLFKVTATNLWRFWSSIFYLYLVRFCLPYSGGTFFSSPAWAGESLRKCDNGLRLPFSSSIYYLYAVRFAFCQEGQSWNDKSSRSSRCGICMPSGVSPLFIWVAEQNLNVAIKNWSLKHLFFEKLQKNS